MNPVAIRPSGSAFRRPLAAPAAAGLTHPRTPDAAAPEGEEGPHRVEGVLPDGRDPYLRDAAERLSTALFHVIHQPTAKGRDRSLGALVALIYGPTPFGGVNSLKEVAARYGMTEQNLFQLMRAHRALLTGTREPEYQI